MIVMGLDKSPESFMNFLCILSIDFLLILSNIGGNLFGFLTQSYKQFFINFTLNFGCDMIRMYKSKAD